ncbi:hypothetical protein [Candidatus Endomicrobiellum agilis]|uniref:hypothetical protein n=1 Tax=Candidatus Endomicrobiellum agilis TaxID=3238957 RepID=UPI00357B813C|nr:hypothetical protein [Endomicrobium sp.]
MKVGRFTVKTASKILKLAALAFLCAFCILVSSHYCRIKDYAGSLLRNLNVVIFFDKNSKDDAVVKDEIEATGLVSVKEYVNSSQAYAKAVEKNPFLKDISVSDIAKSIQSYAVVAPKSVPDKNFLSKMRAALESISGVDEIVFDISVFEHYLKIEDLLSFYRKIFLIFAAVIFTLFVFKCAFLFMEQELNAKKLAANVFSYLLSSSFGFLVLWIVCVYTQYPLLIDKTAALSIMSFIAVLGVILS